MASCIANDHTYSSIVPAKTADSVAHLMTTRGPLRKAKMPVVVLCPSCTRYVDCQDMLGSKQCAVCQQWFHRDCAREPSQFVDKWKCDTC